MPRASFSCHISVWRSKNGMPNIGNENPISTNIENKNDSGLYLQLCFAIGNEDNDDLDHRNDSCPTRDVELSPGDVMRFEQGNGGTHAPNRASSFQVTNGRIVKADESRKIWALDSFSYRATLRKSVSIRAVECSERSAHSFLSDVSFLEDSIECFPPIRGDEDSKRSMRSMANSSPSAAKFARKKVDKSKSKRRPIWSSSLTSTQPERKQNTASSLHLRLGSAASVGGERDRSSKKKSAWRLGSSASCSGIETQSKAQKKSKDTAAESVNGYGERRKNSTFLKEDPVVASSKKSGKLSKKVDASLCRDTLTNFHGSSGLLSRAKGLSSRSLGGRKRSDSADTGMCSPSIDRANSTRSIESMSVSSLADERYDSILDDDSGCHESIGHGTSPSMHDGKNDDTSTRHGLRSMSSIISRKLGESKSIRGWRSSANCEANDDHSGRSMNRSLSAIGSFKKPPKQPKTLKNASTLSRPRRSASPSTLTASDYSERANRQKDSNSVSGGKDFSQKSKRASQLIPAGSAC